MEKMPAKECLFVFMDANARAGQRMGRCGGDESRVLVERMDVMFATTNKIAS